MTELLKKQIDGAIKIKIPKITQAHAKCAKKMKGKKRKRPPTHKNFFDNKDLKSQYSRMAGWIEVNFGILIPNRLKVLVLE